MSNKRERSEKAKELMIELYEWVINEVNDLSNPPQMLYKQMKLQEAINDNITCMASLSPSLTPGKEDLSLPVERYQNAPKLKVGRRRDLDIFLPQLEIVEE